MKFTKSVISIFVLISCVAFSQQATSRNEEILREFSSYRYSKAKIYRISNSQMYQEIFKFFQKDNEKLKKYDPDGTNALVYTDSKFESAKTSLIEIINSSEAAIYSEISVTDDYFKNLKSSLQKTTEKSKDPSVVALGQKEDDLLVKLFNYFIIKYRTPEVVNTFFLITKNKSPQEVTEDDIYGFIKSEADEEAKLPDSPTEVFAGAKSKIYLTKEGSQTDEDINVIASIAKTLKDNGFDVNSDNLAQKDRIEVLAKDPNRNIRYLDLFKLLTFDLKQNNLTDVSFDAKGFGSRTKFFGPSFGVTTKMVKGFIPSENEIQQYRLISEGFSPRTKNAFNEISVAPDQLRWVRYKESIGRVYVYNRTKIEEVKSALFDPKDASKVDDFLLGLGAGIYGDKASAEKNLRDVFEANKNANGLKLADGQTITGLITALIKDTLIAGYGSSVSNLPEIGVELKTGSEEVGLPSFYTGTTSLSLIWGSSQLGVLLPTNGLSNPMNDAIQADPRFTYGGFGLYSKFDFSLPILPQTEVFNFEAAYNFGDAQRSNFNDRRLVADDFTFNQNDVEYFKRFSSSLLYTFAFNIDDSFLFRVGLGGAFYSVESWNNKLDSVSVDGELTPQINFSKLASQGVGGLAIRLEFLNSTSTTPYGARLQYFDNNLFGTAWLQVGLTQDFYIRFSASGFVTSLKNQLRPWEVENYFVPNIKFTYFF